MIPIRSGPKPLRSTVKKLEQPKLRGTVTSEWWKTPYCQTVRYKITWRRYRVRDGHVGVEQLTWFLLLSATSFCLGSVGIDAEAKVKSKIRFQTRIGAESSTPRSDTYEHLDAVVQGIPGTQPQTIDSPGSTSRKAASKSTHSPEKGRVRVGNLNQNRKS